VEFPKVELHLHLDCSLSFQVVEKLLPHITPEIFRQQFVAPAKCLDLAVDEAGHPLTPHVAAFRCTREHGIACTAHAGEACGAENVWEAIKQYRPERIGHRVRSIEDPQLLQYLKRKQIHLEICPSCNVQINIYPNLSEHPIDWLYRQGVSVGVNTDTRTITDVTLSDEYLKLYEVFGWKPDDFYRCNVNAVKAAFLSSGDKQMLQEKLSKFYKTI
jgi:adenosine deaminase